MKQLVPTGFDEYLDEHKVGDVVSGRIVDQSPERIIVELGQGIRTTSRVAASAPAVADAPAAPQLDLSSLTSMLQSRWKGDTKPAPKAADLRVGQIASFRIVTLDREAKKVELEPA